MAEMRLQVARSGGLLGLALAGAMVLAACGGGGGGTAASSGSTAGSSGAASSIKAPTTSSLTGWTVVAGSGGVGPTEDSTMGNPTPPSLDLPGDKSYVSFDAKAAPKTISFDANTQGLFDIFFGADSTGHGLMFRIDTRGGTNYSGFGEVEDWNDWDCPGETGGTADLPANTWLHVALSFTGKDVTAAVTGTGGISESFDFNGTEDSCNTTADGTVLDTDLSTYTPIGTNIAFQGDGLGATSYTWITNFKVA